MIRTLSSIVIIAAIFVAGVYAAPYIRGKLPELPEKIDDRLPKSASVMLDFGNGSMRTFSDVSVSPEGTVFDLLKKITEENGIPLETKEYGGDLGVFVVAIDGVGKDSPDKWWQYWVNNAYSTVGVSGYKVKEGDVVMFKFVEGQQ